MQPTSYLFLSTWLLLSLIFWVWTFAPNYLCILSPIGIWILHGCIYKLKSKKMYFCNSSLCSFGIWTCLLQFGCRSLKFVILFLKIFINSYPLIVNGSSISVKNHQIWWKKEIIVLINCIQLLYFKCNFK